MYLVTSEQMRCFDHFAIETHKIPAIVLMDHAGRAVAKMVCRRHPRQVTVFCGKGNNGGDGWVTARWLHHAGIDVHVITTVDPEADLSGHARTAFESATASGVKWERWSESHASLAESPDVVVDALLGTGCTRPLTGSYQSAANAINLSGAYVIAVDVPTGVNASTGTVPGVAVQSHETVAMQYQKLGTAVTPGAQYAGEVTIVDIGIHAPLPDGLASFSCPTQLRRFWGQRDDISHKGTYGRLGIFVGEMRGAALLSAQGAARTGVGLVVMAGRNMQFGPHVVPPDYVLRDGRRAVDVFTDCQAVVIGPGLGTSVEADEAVRDAMGALSQWSGVIDADGLRLLRRDGDIQCIGDHWVLTPHPKECARMLGIAVDEVQANRVKSATTLAQATGAVVLLKGYRTIIAHPDGTIRVNPTGNAALAVGGSGDVLAGIIGSLMAQGLDAWTAAAIGAWLHGRAGEHAGQDLTSVSTTASDIAGYLPKAVADFVHAGSL